MGVPLSPQTSIKGRLAIITWASKSHEPRQREDAKTARKRTRKYWFRRMWMPATQVGPPRQIVLTDFYAVIEDAAAVTVSVFTMSEKSGTNVVSPSQVQQLAKA